ncbi:MAG: hypothetical protein KDK23_08620 [Leptospiraceae bacterium]|nr:hypothetical protein [Leptospiraceae bacterium]
MNACQKKSVSCFACCGLANLDLNAATQRSILQSRTQEFEALDMDESRFRSFRLDREKKEEGIPRKNSEIYVCPFLGYLEPSRPGCMIHPARTGNPMSQNYSFYGASICLSYDCPSKEKEEQSGISLYSDFLEAEFPEEYHRLICDSALFTLLETIPDFPDSVCSGDKKEVFRRFIGLRLHHPDAAHLTSFERLMVRVSDKDQVIQELFLPGDQPEARDLLQTMKQKGP